MKINEKRYLKVLNKHNKKFFIMSKILVLRRKLEKIKNIWPKASDKYESSSSNIDSSDSSSSLSIDS